MRRAFSLVELLVVIAVIALLIGLLLPALSGARRAARTTLCLHNLRQLAIAHTLYMNDHQELFVDAGLGHGGLTLLPRAWVVVLGEYVGPAMALRSPVDSSRFWPRSQGGECDGPALSELLERVRVAAATGMPTPRVTECRWTSYGLNNFLTRFARPSVRDPVSGAFAGPWEKLSKIPRPEHTVHFLMMTQGGIPGSEPYAKADHVHAHEWDDFGAGAAPELAATQMDVAAHGGTRPDAPPSPSSMTNYGFLDGHARTLRFGSVYRSAQNNAFWPDIAQVTR